ncbi:MAG TPA: tryptophan synthase subunit alpha [Bacilli bacterium]|nr:tryptophan synthase subunit alpha [Bacilli bacterium]
MANERFTQYVENHKEPLFIPFIVAGDPSAEATIDIALTLEEAGAHVIELGIPYSDPLADGPVIQEAGKRALANGMTLEKAMALVPKMREKGLKIPVVIFTYINPLLQFGIDRFLEEAYQYEIDGLLVPDLPFEESEELRQACKKENLAFISLVAPTSESRIQMIAEAADGFLYCVSSLGVTGVRSEFSDTIPQFLRSVKEAAKVPVAVGFGISTREHVEQFAPLCDGVIVGSALVRTIEGVKEKLLSEETRKEGLEQIKRFVLALNS